MFEKKHILDKYRDGYRNIFVWTLVSVTSFIIYQLGAGFYKPTIPQYPASIIAGLQHIQKAWLELTSDFIPSFDPNEWFMKKCLHSRDSNPQPLINGNGNGNDSLPFYPL